MKLDYRMTTFNKQQEEQSSGSLKFKEDGGEENQLITLYPQFTYQSFEGFGGAITESAGHIYSLMNRKQQEKMIRDYFTEDNMRYRMVRMPIDSCDFSLGHYEAISDPEHITSENFQLDRVERILFPLLDDAQSVRKEAIEIMLSPWSPPSFMKSNGNRDQGGSLLKEYYQEWAIYLCNYILAYRNRGYRVTRMSIQNEPKAVQAWDSCVYSQEEEKEFLKSYLWPALHQHGLDDIEVFIWDHNKERALERALALIDEETDRMITGIAFHWYSGDHFEALSMIREKFPNKKLILSESCIEYSKFSHEEYLKNAQKYAHDMIGNLNNGMNGFYDWNLLLDEKGGPNHAGNYCDAPYLFDTHNKELIKRNTAVYLWHFTHFIKKDAVRIGFSKYTKDLEITSFLNKDGSMVMVILNQTKDEIPVNIRIGEYMVSLLIKPESICSGVIDGGNN